MFADHLTVQSYNPATSTWVTEAVEDFTVDGSGYTVDTLDYDSNGNLTYDGVQTYAYDAWNRLKSVAHAYKDSGGTRHDGQVFCAIGYDAGGRRITKAITGTGVEDCTYHYYLSGSSVIEERNGSDQAIKDHVWGLGYVDEAVQTRVNTTPSSTATWSAYYHLQDANFNDLGLLNSSGALVERYEYSAYGQRQVFYSAGANDPGCYAPTPQSKKVVTSGSITQPYGINEAGHQGLLHDEQTGLAYARMRYLNTAVGRWNTAEPFGGKYIDGPNLYWAYHRNSIRLNDPFGLESPGGLKLGPSTGSPEPEWGGMRGSGGGAPRPGTGGSPGPAGGRNGSLPMDGQLQGGLAAIGLWASVFETYGNWWVEYNGDYAYVQNELGNAAAMALARNIRALQAARRRHPPVQPVPPVPQPGDCPPKNPCDEPPPDAYGRMEDNHVDPIHMGVR